MLSVAVVTPIYLPKSHASAAEEFTITDEGFRYSLIAAEPLRVAIRSPGADDARPGRAYIGTRLAVTNLQKDRSARGPHLLLAAIVPYKYLVTPPGTPIEGLFGKSSATCDNGVAGIEDYGAFSIMETGIVPAESCPVTLTTNEGGTVGGRGLNGVTLGPGETRSFYYDTGGAYVRDSTPPTDLGLVGLVPCDNCKEAAFSIPFRSGSTPGSTVIPTTTTPGVTNATTASTSGLARRAQSDSEAAKQQGDVGGRLKQGLRNASIGVLVGVPAGCAMGATAGAVGGTALAPGLGTVAGAGALCVGGAIVEGVGGLVGGFVSGVLLG